MTDVFQLISNQVRNSKFSIIVMIFSLIMFILGLNHFYEDYLAGLMGIHELESTYGLRFAVRDITYKTMAISPQIAQVVFGFAFLLDVRKNKWYGVLAIVFFLMDFVPDLWYRSNGDPLQSIAKFSIAGFMTFSFFTVGSELFITVGGGTLLEMTKPTLNQLFDLVGVNYRFNVSNSSRFRPKPNKNVGYPSHSRSFKNIPEPFERSAPKRNVLANERDILRYIEQYYRDNGKTPSYSKIVKNTELKSTSAVRPYIELFNSRIS